MRDIRFRGMRKDKTEWVEGSLLQFQVTFPNGSTAWQIDIVDETNKPFGVIRETVGQYTGLKDKNGRDIWEGDILVEWFGGKRLEWSTWKVAIVSLTSGRYCCVSANHPEEDRGFNPFFNWEDGEWDDMRRLEVIGNIHENGDLLKE
jgi:uncharacterized phage protein (TIGR01671 family)